MSSVELPDADVIEQQTSIDDVEDRDGDFRALPIEADPADVVEQSRSLGFDDGRDYPLG
jgi:hypothetical protein